MATRCNEAARLGTVHMRVPRVALELRLQHRSDFEAAFALRFPCLGVRWAAYRMALAHRQMDRWRSAQLHT